MRRHASRHATPHENADAIGNLDPRGAELVLRGVADRTIDPYATSGYPQPAAQTIATWPYASTPNLAALVADQLTPGLADRTGWALFQWMQDRHLIPAIGVIAGDVCGWGAAATEPNHPWFGSVILGFGIVAGLAYGALHVIRAINGDDGVPISKGAHAVGVIGVTLTSFGIACITGMSWLSGGISALLPGGIGYWAWFENRHSRLQDQRGYLVEQTAAATPTIVPMPGGTQAALPPPIAGELVSHEETIIRKAFADMGIEPITLRAFERIDESAFNVIVGLPGSRADDPESIVRRSETLKSNLRANQIAVEASTDQGNEVALMVRFGSASPILEVIPWAGPQTDDCTQPIRVGLFHYGEPVHALFAKRHTLYGGKTRRGKSSGMQVAVCSIGATTNGQVWLIDMKPGQLSLGPFDVLASQSADTLEQAALLITAAVAAMEENGQILKEERERTGTAVWEWDPAEHGAGIFLFIDEMADLLRLDPDIFEAWLRIMQLGAGLGVYIVAGTQSPSAKALGGTTDGSSQFVNTFGYQAKGATQAGIIFGQGAWGEGWKPSERNLPLQGMFMLRSPELPHPIVARGDFIQPDSAMRIAAEIADRVPRARLHPRTAAAVQRVLDEGLPTGTGPGGGRGTGRRTQPQDAPAYGRPRLVTLYPDGTKVDAKHEPYWELLGSLGERGATVGELQLAGNRAGLGRSLAWVRDMCKAWREARNVMVEEGKEPRYWRDDEQLGRQHRREA